MKILANDGISKSGKEQLENAGFEVIETKVAQEQLSNYINEQQIQVLIVRSSTKVGKDIIDACPNLKMIVRAGVGLDNISIDYARSQGIEVYNTPEASATAVAELVFAHLFGGVRFLHEANRLMPLEGDSRFKDLKKSYGTGTELKGKTLGVIGLGRIGKEVARIALGIGMKVIATATTNRMTSINIEFQNHSQIEIPVNTIALDELLQQADFITLHLPAQQKPVLDASAFKKMKKGVGIINAARGGVVDEDALLNAIEEGTVSFAGLDVFTGEPAPALRILMNENLSLSPHIGAGTAEAQERIGQEVANLIISKLK